MGMASGVRRQSHETPGYKAFQEHYSTLVVGIQGPAELAGKLFSRKMITDGIRTKVENLMADKLTRCRELLTAVMSEIASDPNSFCTFIEVLEEEPTLQVIAESMKKNCKTHEHVQLVHPAHERISLKDHRCWLVVFIGGLLLALLGGHLYTTYDLQEQSEVAATSPPLNTTHNCTELKKLSIPHASDEIAPNNLPNVPGHFVGRDSELQEIIHMLIHSTHSGVTMVNIYGAPAVGKSTLAIQVGHQLARHGIVVRYVNVNEAHKLFVGTSETANGEQPSSIHSHTTDTSTQSTDITSHSTGGVLAIPWYSYTEKKYVLTSPQKLMEWAKGLTHDTLLVLDNCDDLLQRNKTQESKFKEILRELLEASNYLRVVVTSRAQILLVGGFRPYPLTELDPTSAVHLLQLQSSLISSEEGKVIAELVGYNPLGLGIVAGLVNSNERISLPFIIEDLKQQPIETLSPATLPESQQILTVLRLSYNYLHGEIQMCSQYLSHFPGSFHRDAALSILGMCNFSDPDHCLETLTRRSFLEAYWRAGQPRYQFHRLIREFLQFIQSEYSDDRIETEFSLYYQRYYSQSIAILSQLYSRNSYSNEIISSLESDTHNFLKILQEMVELQLDTKSVLNIAYGIKNSTSVFLEILDCNDYFAKLLKVLMILFDQKVFKISQEIGLNETTILYFNLLSVVKEWLIQSGTNTEDSCITVCWEIFVDHRSRVEKLSTADSNTLDSYYYHPFTCYLDCTPSVDYNKKDLIVSITLWLVISTCIYSIVCGTIRIFFTSFHKKYLYACILCTEVIAITIFFLLLISQAEIIVMDDIILLSESIAVFVCVGDQQFHIKFLMPALMTFVAEWYVVIVVRLSFFLYLYNNIIVYLYYGLIILPICVGIGCLRHKIIKILIVSGFVLWYMYYFHCMFRVSFIMHFIFVLIVHYYNRIRLM